MTNERKAMQNLKAIDGAVSNLTLQMENVLKGLKEVKQQIKEVQKTVNSIKESLEND